MSQIEAKTRSAPRRSSRKSWTSAMRPADERFAFPTSMCGSESSACADIDSDAMIVGIDGRSLAPGRAERGVAHYTASLAGALAAAHPGDDWRTLREPGRLRHLSAALTGRPRL